MLLHLIRPQGRRSQGEPALGDLKGRGIAAAQPLLHGEGPQRRAMEGKARPGQQCASKTTLGQQALQHQPGLAPLLGRAPLPIHFAHQQQLSGKIQPHQAAQGHTMLPALEPRSLFSARHQVEHAIHGQHPRLQRQQVIRQQRLGRHHAHQGISPGTCRPKERHLVRRFHPPFAAGGVQARGSTQPGGSAVLTRQGQSLSLPLGPLRGEVLLGLPQDQSIILPLKQPPVLRHEAVGPGHLAPIPRSCQQGLAHAGSLAGIRPKSRLGIGRTLGGEGRIRLLPQEARLAQGHPVGHALGIPRCLRRPGGVERGRFQTFRHRCHEQGMG